MDSIQTGPHPTEYPVISGLYNFIISEKAQTNVILGRKKIYNHEQDECVCVCVCVCIQV